MLLVWLGLGWGGGLLAQTSSSPTRSTSSLDIPGAAARDANPPAEPLPQESPPPAPVIPVAQPVAPVPATPAPANASASESTDVNVDPTAAVLAGLMVLGSLSGFLLYQTGLTRAKNCAHTSMLVLIGVAFALLAYWAGGFAVQAGGMGDAHAALAQPIDPTEKGALNDELGFVVLGHRWGLMGSGVFFLMTDEPVRAGIAALFLGQAVWLAMAVAASLGAALERGRLLAMAVTAFITGAVIYPLVANWIWGGGWLAALGRNVGWGHGVVDLSGAGVAHETAGTIAFAIALALKPRHGRFTRNKITGVPGHNVPFIVLGALILLVTFTVSGVSGSASADPSGALGGLAAVNVLLGAIGAMLAALFLGAWRKLKATPFRLTRALLGGAVSLCGGGALFDPWAAFLIGACAGLLIDALHVVFERNHIDDPSGASSIHGACGAWGLLVTGIFANGSAGGGINGVDGSVRGLIFSGGWRQLAAQALGCADVFIVVFVLAYVSLQITQKILGNRVRVGDEIQGLDWPQVGALGYQPDVESEYPDSR